MENQFTWGQSVYLVIDRSEWIVTHVVIDLNGGFLYRISNGYSVIEVHEIELTNEPPCQLEIKGFVKQ